MATVTACTFSNDSAGGAGGAGGVTLNQGRGATVTACTFSNDSAPQGGGMDNTGTATLTNCTFSNDSAFTSAGGGIWNPAGASITVTNCTIANNSALKGSGGGIWNGQGTLILTNTIVAQNTAAVPGRDVDNSGTVTTDHDLIGKGAGSGISKRGGNIVGKGNSAIDPRLGPLKDNGGPTQTLALLRDSPAIGHADDAAAPPTDQRGHPHTNHFGGHTDIGAYEYESPHKITKIDGSIVGASRL